MPLVTITCVNGHASEQYLATWDQQATQPSRICACGQPYLVQPSYGVPLTYFRESRPQYIQNLGATIRSHGEHVRVMQQRGVEYATQWHTSTRKMSDGLRPRAAPPRSQKGV